MKIEITNVLCRCCKNNLSRMLEKYGIAYDEKKCRGSRYHLDIAPAQAVLLRTELKGTEHRIVLDDKALAEFTDFALREWLQEFEKRNMAHTLILDEKKERRKFVSTLTGETYNKWVRAFKDIKGVSAFNFFMQIKFDRIEELFEEGVEISVIMERLGFWDIYYLTKKFKEIKGYPLTAD